MPKPVRNDRTNVFGDGGAQQGLPAPGFYSMTKANQAYEQGAHEGLFADEDFISPDTKRAQQLEQELLALQGQLAQQVSGSSIQDGSLMVAGFQFSPTGLIAPDEFSEEAWQQIGLLLFKLEGSIQWLIGDWIVYGDQVGWGDIPKIADALGREARTLHDYTYVARHVQFSIRIENLSFGHHQMIAALEPDQQAAYLHHAAYSESKPLSVARFRKWINEQKAGAEVALSTLPTGDQSTPAFSDGQNYRILSRQYERWLAADPKRAHPDERNQAHEIGRQMMQGVLDYYRKWGIE